MDDIIGQMNYYSIYRSNARRFKCYNSDLFPIYERPTWSVPTPFCTLLDFGPQTPTLKFDVKQFDDLYYNQKDWKHLIKKVNNEIKYRPKEMEIETEFSPFQSAPPVETPCWTESDLYRPLPPFEAPLCWEQFSSPIKASLFCGMLDPNVIDDTGSFKKDPFLFDDIKSSLEEKGITIMDTPVPIISSKFLLDIREKSQSLNEIAGISTAIYSPFHNLVKEIRHRKPLKNVTIEILEVAECPVKKAFEESYKSLSKNMELQRRDMKIAKDLATFKADLYKDIKTFKFQGKMVFSDAFVKDMDFQFPSFALVRKQLISSDIKLLRVVDDDFYLVRF